MHGGFYNQEAVTDAMRLTFHKSLDVHTVIASALAALRKFKKVNVTTVSESGSPASTD